MKIRSCAIDMLRWTLVLLTCVIPATAFAAGTVTVTNSISPAGEYPNVDGYVVLMQGSNYTVSYGFSVETTQTPTAVEATYRFGTRSGRLTASVSGGKITISPLRFRDLSPGDYQLSCTINCTYSGGSTETINGASDTGVRIISQASSSVEKTVYDAVLSDNTVTLGPITMTGGYAGGWNVVWSAGIPTGANNASCIYRPTTTDYQVNTVTATVTNSMGGEELYRQVYEFTIPSYGRPTARITGAPAAIYAGSQLSLHVNTSGGNPDGWHYNWIGGDGTDSPDYTFTVSTPATGSSTGTSRVEVSNVSPEGVSWFNDNIGVNYTVYPQPTVSFTDVDFTIVSPGTVVPLQMTATGGQSGRWSYQWTLDGVRQSTASQYTYTAPSDGGFAVNTVRGTATNNASDVAAPYEETREYKFIVLPGGGSSSGLTQDVATFSGTPVRLHVDLENTGIDWKYVWWIPSLVSQEGNLPSTTNEQMFDRDVTEPTEYGVVCRASATVDGTPVEINYRFNVTVYPTPSAPMVFEPDYRWYVAGEQVSVTLNSTGGDSNAWRYNWFIDFSEVGHERSYTFTAPNNGSFPQHINVSGQAINSPSNLGAGVESMITNRTVEIYTYPAPSFSVGQDTYNILSGSPVNIHVETSGAFWTYVWTEDGNDMMVDSPDLQISPVNNGNTVITKTYKVIATCWVPNGDHSERRTVATEEHTFTVNVYPASTASWADTYTENIIAGTNVPMSIRLADGNPDNWSINWYVNDAFVSYTTGIDYTFNRTEPGTYTVKAVVTNRAEPSLSFDMTHTFNVYAAPSVTVEKTDYRILSGTQLTLSVNTTGGAEWRYTWYEDGRVVPGNSSELSIAPENTTDAVINKVYTVDASCYLPGDELVTTESRAFTVAVYPASTARFAEDYPSEILVERAVTMSVELADGNTSNWNISWYVNGSIISYVNGTTWDFYRTTPGTYEVKVRIVNRSNSVLSFELSHIFNVYAKPSLQNTQTVSDQYAYSGTAITYTERVSGGYPDGWTWEVFENETSLATGTGDLHYTFVSPQTTSPTQRILRMVFKNSLDGADENVFELEKRIHVYGRPSATLNAQPNVTAIGVGESILYEVETSDAPGEWTYEWTLDGAPVSTSRTYNYNAPASLSSMESHEVKVKAILTSSYANMSWETELTRTLEVWPDGAISSPEVQNVGVIAGSPLTIGVNVIGTLSGWTFAWTRNGTAFTNAQPTYNYNYSTEDVGRTDVYTVHATYVREGTPTFDRTYTINVTVYPVPECSLGTDYVNCYTGSRVTQSISYSGGNPDGWHTEWNVFEQTGEGQSFEFSVPAGLGNGTSYDGFVRLYNLSPDGGVIYDENFYFKIVVYTYGSARIYTPDYHDFMYQANQPMEIVVEGGYPEGWTYRWHSADGGFDVMGGPVFTPETVNPNQTNMTLTVNVEIINRIGDEEGFHGFSDFTYVLWPRVQVDITPSLTPRNVRQGEAVELSIGATGGNSEGWSYYWMANSSYLSSMAAVSYVPVPYYGNADKTVNTIEYRVNVANLGPQNQTWYDAASEAATLNVYGQPTAPSQVLIKGNGTSHTLIAMMSNDDSLLEEQGYTYVFGYTDYNGIDYSLDPTPYRYNHFTTEQFNSANNNFWAYTRWAYPDGSIVTSGKRYLSGYLDESFDASVYAGGRGDAAGIDAIEAGGLYSDGYSFRAEPTVPAEAIVNVYSAAGRVVRVLHYPKQSSFDELIELGGLHAGMYIVEVQVGGLRTVKKVVVDNK